MSKAKTLDAFKETVAFGNQSLDEAFANAPLDSVVNDVALDKQIVQGQFQHFQGQLGRGELSPEELMAKLNGSSPHKPFPGLPGLPPLPLFGGEDNDLLRGKAGNDLLDGGAGDDTLFGMDGHDTLAGDDGNDILRGQSGNDLLDGGAGDDTLFGGNQFDRLSGGAGNDLLDGVNGITIYNGGSGSDLFVIHNDALTDWVQDFEIGVDNIGLADGVAFEQLEITGSVNSFISFQGNQVAALLGVNPDKLSADSFREL